MEVINLELELQKDRLQAAGIDTPQADEPPETDRTYTRTEMEQIIKEHLIRFQSLPVQEAQQAELADRELSLDKKTYLTQKIQKFAVTLPPRQGLMTFSPYETFIEESENLYLLLEHRDMDSFTRAVDAMFSLIEYVRKSSYDAGYNERVAEEDERTNERDLPQKAKTDIISEIFKIGGRI